MGNVSTKHADNLIDLKTPARPRVPAYAVTATICRISGAGEVFVDLPDADEPTSALCTIELDAAHIGREAVIVFLDGDAARPAIVGVTKARARRPWSSLQLDGETLTLEATRELVLRCGRATLKLRADGRVELRGVRVTSRASQTNAIKGGTVRLN
jgi:hypothetical protein